MQYLKHPSFEYEYNGTSAPGFLKERVLKIKVGRVQDNAKYEALSSLGACTVHTSVNSESCISAPVHT